MSWISDFNDGGRGGGVELDLFQAKTCHYCLSGRIVEDGACQACIDWWRAQAPDLGEKRYRLWWAQEGTGRVVLSGLLTLGAAQGILERPVGIRLGMTLAECGVHA